jgi:O-succinylbenzoate-CoA ligase
MQIVENNIGLLLSKRAFLTPNVEAVVEVERNRRFTYEELNRRSNRVANRLLAEGVIPGDRVGLLLMNGVEFVESFFALAKIGAVLVPLNWRLVADELEFILSDSGTQVLIFGGEFSEIAADLHSRGDKTALRSWFQSGGDTLLEFACDYDTEASASSSKEPETGARDGDVIYIMYTAGTTGIPKGVVHTHDTCLAGQATAIPCNDFRRGDRFLSVLPIFHVGALTPIITNIYGGTTTVICREFDPLKIWETFERERITCALLVPAMLNFMWQVPDKQKYDYSQLRWVLSGASPVPVTSIEQYSSLGIEVHQAYGLTETCGPGCLLDGSDALAKAGSTGKAFFHTDVMVVDENMQEVADNVPGEILIRGRHVMKEYWNRPEATQETLIDGWVKTGDLATRDEDGYIYIIDRVKDMLISGGENIYPAEIENVILAHPSVAEVAVIGQHSERWGESPLAVVVRSDEGLDAQKILDHCEGKLAKFKMPKSVEFVDEIPRNPAGKVLKRVLRKQFRMPAQA